MTPVWLTDLADYHHSKVSCQAPQRPLACGLTVAVVRRSTEDVKSDSTIRLRRREACLRLPPIVAHRQEEPLP